MSKKEKNISSEEELDINVQENTEHTEQNSKEEVFEAKDNIKDDNVDQDSESLTLDALKRQLEHLKQKADSNYELALRSKAELDNVRRRSEKEISGAHKYALEKFVPDLLPILDSIDQGILSANIDDKQIESIDSALNMVKSVKEGMGLTAKMFEDTFKKFGVKMQDPMGHKFDPHLHQAVMMQPDEEKEAGTIIKVLQKGYILNDRVIRPAMVIVVQEK
tara:strand:- start:9311 stop:9970 length:660 start_codon:yes stop_codon:yes gene_type:complete